MSSSDGFPLDQPSGTEAIARLADGTVKQINLLSGTEVWTVPGRSSRPLPSSVTADEPIDFSQEGSWCAFCQNRYLETPPEKLRWIKSEAGWQKLETLGANQLFDSVAEFRRVPNLFEIVSYNYWRLNHGHQPTEEQRRRMAEYLASDVGYEHIMSVVKARLLATGTTPAQFEEMNETEKLHLANGFFSGGHDLIIAKRHYEEGAATTDALAGSGTLTPEEHHYYMRATVEAMEDLYNLDPAVRYVVAFQNWLKPAGASFDHLHKQLVAIDEQAVQTKAEMSHLDADPRIYEKILQVAATRRLLVAQNDHALAFADFGHRYPTLAVWPTGPVYNPWEASEEQLKGVSDLVHAMHAVTGVEIPSNEEWHHRPPDATSPLRWRILLKWRISTMAGFEGGTRIYLNTIDPWQVQAKAVARLKELRELGLIAPMRIGEECQARPELLQ